MKMGRLVLMSVRVAATVAVTTPLRPAAAAPHHGPEVTFERGRRDLPKLALTFDGGSDAGETEQILAVLRQRGVSATFFLTGRFVQRYPDLVRRIASEGHEVGNHTWSHPHLTTWERSGRHDTRPGLGREWLLAELDRTARAFETAAGRPMAPLWRAPYGEVNAELMRWAAAAGWRHVGWTRDDAGGRHSLDSLDWVSEPSSRNYLTSVQIAERILSFGTGADGLNGGIVLMHLSSRKEDPGVGRLGELVDALRGGGYNLVTVSELQRDVRRPDGQVALATTAVR